MKVGIISGYFNPITFGHIQYINESKKQCDHLVVVINNDQQVKLKGSIPFMNSYHRFQIINNIKNVDAAIISRDIDITVCESIKYLKNSVYPNDELFFFNSGDRTDETVNTGEKDLCNSLNIKFVLLPMSKVYSSSQLIKDASVEVFKRLTNTY